MQKFDVPKRKALAELVARMLDSAPGNAVPVISIESFFDGNRDEGSIGCNLRPHPGVTRFHDVLLRIRSLPTVQDVLVGIHDASDPGSWPYAETVYVLTTSPTQEIADLAVELQPSEVVDNELFNVIIGLPAPRPGMRTVLLWWD